jgi:hypothetical protein
MKRAVLLVLMLTGCQTTEDRIAQDDRQCKSYGVKPGDQAYMQCRMNLDTNRANIKAAERFGNGGPGLIDRIAGTAKE